MSTPNSLTSPTLSATSNMSSFIMLSSNTHSSSVPRSDDSDDEIIYSVSEDSLSTADESLDSAITSDHDFVVLSRPRSQRSILETEISTPGRDDDARTDTPSITDLVTGLANLTVTKSGSGRRRRKAKASEAVAVTRFVGKKQLKKSQPSSVNAAASSPSPSLARSKRAAASTILPVTEALVVVKTQSKKVKKKKTPSPVNTAASSSGPSSVRSERGAAQTIQPVTEKQAVAKTRSKKVNKEKPTGFGGRSIVDDVSDKFSDYGESDAGSPSMYEEAFGFITSFLSNPAARQDSACRLTLLQALIIELGLAPSSLPSSLTAAKAYLKSRAFLNITEYIAVRDQGPAAVQRIMHSSRNALIKDLRKNKKKKASLGWVKDSGLQVLLVQCSH